MSERIAILGAGSRMGGAGSIGSLITVADQVKKNELTKRNLLLAELTQQYTGRNVLEEFYRLTPKKLKAKSKEFHCVYRYLEPLQLRTYCNTNKLPPKGEVIRAVKTIHALTRSKAFQIMNFEDPTTDFFELVFVAVLALQDIIQRHTKLDQQTRTHIVLMTADLKERLYSMYVDNRLDSAMEDENVIMR